MTPESTDPERYGQTRVGKIRAAFNDLRSAIRSGDTEAAEKALDRYEPWADYVFDARHKETVQKPGEASNYKGVMGGNPQSR